MNENNNFAKKVQENISEYFKNEDKFLDSFCESFPNKKAKALKNVQFVESTCEYILENSSNNSKEINNYSISNIVNMSNNKRIKLINELSDKIKSCEEFNKLSYLINIKKLFILKMVNLKLTSI